MAGSPSSAKNFALSPAASDLGLGGQLQAQVDAEIARRRKAGKSFTNGTMDNLSAAGMSLLANANPGGVSGSQSGYGYGYGYGTPG